MRSSPSARKLPFKPPAAIGARGKVWRVRHPARETAKGKGVRSGVTVAPPWRSRSRARISTILRNTAIGLAAAASLSLSAAALTPALAESQTPQGFINVNYAPCTEDPEGKGCPGSLAPISPQSSSEHAPAKHVVHVHNYRAPRPTTKG